jgi:hypothetical protein
VVRQLPQLVYLAAPPEELEMPEAQEAWCNTAKHRTLLHFHHCGRELSVESCPAVRTTLFT